MQENEIPNPYIFNGDVVPPFLIPNTADDRIRISCQPCIKTINQHGF